MLGDKHCHEAQSLANTMLREPHLYGAPRLGRTTFTEHRFQGAPCSGSITQKNATVCSLSVDISSRCLAWRGFTFSSLGRNQGHPPLEFRYVVQRALRVSVCTNCMSKTKNTMGERALEQAGADPEPGLYGRNLLYCWFGKCIHDCVGFKFFTWSHCNSFKQMIAI